MCSTGAMHISLAAKVEKIACAITEVFQDMLLKFQDLISRLNHKFPQVQSAWTFTTTYLYFEVQLRNRRLILQWLPNFVKTHRVGAGTTLHVVDDNNTSLELQTLKCLFFISQGRILVWQTLAHAQPHLLHNATSAQSKRRQWFEIFIYRTAQWVRSGKSYQLELRQKLLAVRHLLELPGRRLVQYRVGKGYQSHLTVKGQPKRTTVSEGGYYPYFK